MSGYGYTSSHSEILSDSPKEIIREAVRDFLRARGSLGIVPAGNPVDGAEERERRELCVGRVEASAAEALMQDAADALIETVAARDHGLEVRRCQRFQIEK